MLSSLISSLGRNDCWMCAREPEAPSVPMFGAKRSRGQCGQGGQSDLTDALTGMAKTTVSALKPDSELASSAVRVGYSSPNRQQIFDLSTFANSRNFMSFMRTEPYVIPNIKNNIVGLVRQLK